MGRIASIIGSHPVLRLAVLGCIAASLAGCADSERFAGSDPFSNPFHNSDRTPTGSVGSAQPNDQVSSRPLPPSGGSNYSSNYGTNYSSASYTAPAHPNPNSYASGRSEESVAGWTAEGGMPIVVAQGETAEIVARRYGIPETALLRTNGFHASSQVRPGTRLIIPTYNAALAASSGVNVSHPEHLHFVKGPAPAAERIKQAKEIKRHEDKIARADHVPASKIAARSEPKPAKIEKVALTDTGSQAEPKRPVDPAPLTTGQIDSGKTDITATAPEFRWPARGRIIRGFAGNDGINIALPEGTPVKAAEAGVVAYAGNELKGYGNLILIRHLNGFVSAYANTAEIDVKRGETVRRGQVIAKSGQTGNVSTPQLHFELRKGSKPVDPIQYLAGL